MRLTGLAPVLLVPDVREALAHYRDVLGFEVEAWSGEPTDYGYASRDACTIHLGRGERAHPNAELRPPDLFDVYLYVDDVEALRERARSAGADIVNELVEQPNGDRRCDIRDPEGHMWSFAQAPN